jgi:hypothetical protein
MESLAIMRLLLHEGTPVVAVGVVSDRGRRGSAVRFWSVPWIAWDDSSSGGCSSGAHRPWGVARFESVRPDELQGNDHLGSLPRSLCRTTHSRT